MSRKQIKWVAGGMAAAFLAGMLALHAGTIIIGSMATWTTGTNYSVWVPLFTVPVPSKTFSIQTAGLTATNDLPMWGQIAFNTNYPVTTTGAAWYPSATNAGTYSWTTAVTNIQVYGRVFSIQTNTVTISGNLN